MSAVQDRRVFGAEEQGPPPHITFEVRPQEDRNASEEAGHYVARDVEYIMLRPRGDDGKTVVEREITDRDRERFAAQYDAWKKGIDAPIDGTPLRDWPPATPAQIKNLHAVNIFSVEELAEINETGIRAMGMGGRALQQKARVWLESASSQGKVAEEVASLTAAMTDMKAEMERMREENESLKAQVNQPRRGPGRPRKDEQR